jgi:hypothetical protein
LIRNTKTVAAIANAYKAIVRSLVSILQISLRDVE